MLQLRLIQQINVVHVAGGIHRTQPGVSANDVAGWRFGELHAVGFGSMKQTEMAKVGGVCSVEGHCL